MSKKRTPTVARGAVIERSLIQRWIARQIRKYDTDAVELFVLGDLSDWLKAQPTRTKRKGGIGR